MEQIGYIKKIHGLKGALVLKLLSKMHFLGKAKDALFIEQQGNLVPYFIEEMGGSHPEWIVKIDQISHLEAGKMVGLKVFAAPDKFVIEQSFTSEFNHLIGYTFIDATSSKQGAITDIEEMSFQTIIYVQIEGKEILVPLNMDWIIEIIEAEKIIHYNCPEGLIAIYLD
jgi:16S rRNA processing protein RimM